MRVGITLDDERGLEGEVCEHFGQCRYFLLVDIENGKIAKSSVVANTAVHGGGGCLAVDEILKHKITHVIAGGMGGGAQKKFLQAKVQVFGFSGKVKEALDLFMKRALSGIDACAGHSGCH